MKWHYSEINGVWTGRGRTGVQSLVLSHICSGTYLPKESRASHMTSVCFLSFLVPMEHSLLLTCNNSRHFWSASGPFKPINSHVWVFISEAHCFSNWLLKSVWKDHGHNLLLFLEDRKIRSLYRYKDLSFRASQQFVFLGFKISLIKQVKLQKHKYMIIWGACT